MGDEYQLRKDVDKLNDLAWSTIDGQSKLVDKESFEELQDDISNNYVDNDKLEVELSTKQDTLISGETIKTINNNSLLGEGNISISGGTGGVTAVGSFSINNNGHLIVELPSGMANPYTINNNGHLIYDTSASTNEE